jgi:hypothetical protein
MVELLQSSSGSTRMPADVIHPGGAVNLATSHSALAETPGGDMAISLGFGPADLARCRFACSPVFETLAAVRVATGPDGPGLHHRRWLADADKRLRALDLRPVTLLQPRRGYTPDFLAPPPAAPTSDIESELMRIAATPASVVRQEIELSLSETPGAHPRRRVSAE